MKAKDLFTIILKIFGIYLIKDVLSAIPPVLAEVVRILQVSPEIGIVSLVFSLITLGFHLGIVYLLLFKTNFLISKLSLTSDFSEEPLRSNIHRSQIYTISIIVSGIIILAFAIPNLIKHLYFWYEFLDSKKKDFIDQSYDFSGILVGISEVVIGLLFLGNQKTIVNFIELKRRESNGG